MPQFVSSSKACNSLFMTARRNRNKKRKRTRMDRGRTEKGRTARERTVRGRRLKGGGTLVRSKSKAIFHEKR